MIALQITGPCMNSGMGVLVYSITGTLVATKGASSIRESVSCCFFSLLLSFGIVFFMWTVVSNCFSLDFKRCSISAQIKKSQNVFKQYLNSIIQDRHQNCLYFFGVSVGCLFSCWGFGPWIGFYQLERVKQEANLRCPDGRRVIGMRCWS